VFTFGSGTLTSHTLNISTLKAFVTDALLLHLHRYLNAKSDEDRKEVERIRSHHREHVTYTRRRAEGQMQLCEHPALRDKLLNIIIDGMDSKKAQVSYPSIFL
jgi:hypothetical protein